MTFMLEKSKARRVMKALYDLFIHIRSYPEDPINKEILLAFHRHLGSDKGLSHIKALIQDLEKLNVRSSFLVYLIGSLKKFEFKTGKYTMGRINKSLPILQEIVYTLSKKIEDKEFEKAKIMASAVHNYPDFLILEYKSDPEKFWEEHIGYYSRTFQEDFLNEWEHLFRGFYKTH